MTRRRYQRHLQAAYDAGYMDELDGWPEQTHWPDQWHWMAYDRGRQDAELMRAEGFA